MRRKSGRWRPFRKESSCDPFGSCVGPCGATFSEQKKLALRSDLTTVISETQKLRPHGLAADGLSRSVLVGLDAFAPDVLVWTHTTPTHEKAIQGSIHPRSRPLRGRHFVRGSSSGDRFAVER